MTNVTKDQRLRFLIFQEAPGHWLVRGLEHDVMAEARTIGEAIRAAIRLVEAHTAFDIRHSHVPLSAFRPAPQTFWSAYAAGTPVPLDQLGVVPLEDWEICAAVAHRNPVEPRWTRSIEGSRIPGREADFRFGDLVERR